MARLWSIESVGPIELQRWERVWATTGNTAAAWRCFRLARALSLPVPPLVLAEIDRIAEAIEGEVGRVRARESKAGLRRATMARIFTRTARGSSEPAAELIRWERDFAIAGAVAVLRQLHGLTEKTAVERVAKGTNDIARRLSLAEGRATMVEVHTPGMSVAAVRRAVVRVRRLLPDAAG